MKFRHEPLSNASDAARAVRDGGGVILEENGQPVAALISMSDLEDWLDASDPAVTKRIAESRRDYEAGNVRPAGALVEKLHSTDE